MKKILCPIDSTPVSHRLVQYTGSLARDTQSKVYLISTEQEKKSLVFAGVRQQGSGRRLDELHDYLSGIKHVPCGVEEEAITGNRHKKLGAIADRYDLMTLAVLQSESQALSAQGLDLIKVLQETFAPILLVPDHFQYQKIKRLLYAYDYKHEPKPPLAELHWLADWFGAEVRFISVMQSDTSIHEEDRLNSLHNMIMNSWKGKNEISFETIIHPDVPRCLEHYLSLWKMNDLLVLSINHHNMLERLWHKSVVKGLLNRTLNPYLIIHH
jgi:hypothetical protein